MNRNSLDGFRRVFRFGLSFTLGFALGTLALALSFGLVISIVDSILGAIRYGSPLFPPFNLGESVVGLFLFWGVGRALEIV